MHLRPTLARSALVAVAGIVLVQSAVSCSGPDPINAVLPATAPTTAPGTLSPATVPTVAGKTLTEIASAAREDLAWLAADAREGRGLGTKGLDESAEFIAARYAKLGLKPLPQLDGYFQPVDYNAGTKLGLDTRLAFNGTPVAADGFTGFNNSEEGDVKGEVAFVGYSINSDARSYNDYTGLDVNGRVVLAMRWEPHDETGKSRWSNEGYSVEAAISRKVEAAAEAGAAAFILVNAPTHHDDVEKLMDPRSGLRRRSSIPVFNVTVETADAMLKAGGAPTLAELQKEIDEKTAPASRLLEGVTVEGNVELVADSSKARNVAALLPGSGPRADEYVVVGAHYDHVGRGAYGGRGGAGRIHNGADDNGSGTVTVLQLAEAFQRAGPQDRSIVLVNFTLEELGLVGSEAFMEKLPLPKDKIVGMLNLDMVGRLRNGFLYVGGGGTAEAFEGILSNADARSPADLKSIGKGGLGPSDHLNFSKAGIPSIFFYTGMHSDYHAPGDDVEKINYDGIAQITAIAFDVIRGMSEMPRQTYIDRFDNLEPDTDVSSGESPTTRRVGVIVRSRVSLGVGPDYSADQSVKGVLLDSITPNSAAAEAGLKPQDVITKLNDREIDNLTDLTAFLSEAQPGDKVTITLLRNSEPMTVEATLKARGR